MKLTGIDDIFSDPSKCPNMRCYRYVLNEFENNGYFDEDTKGISEVEIKQKEVDNITLWNDQIDNEDIIQAAKDACIHDDILKKDNAYEELLEDSAVDAVYIANPHAFHFESVIACLNAGKHVLCEKPAGCSREQLDKMINLARSKNLFFMEAMWTAFNPCIAKIKEIIADGKIGKIKHIESHFCNRIAYDPKNRLYAPELAGGALLDLGIYNIYFAMMINDFSPIRERSSNVRLLNGVDVWNSVNLTFENGVTTSFQSACDRPAGSNSHDAIIYGEKGFITAENFFFAQKADLHTYINTWGNENEITETINEPFSVNGYEYEVQAATDHILKGELESSVHPHSHSIALCKIMDELRKDWNMKYPFE